MSQRSIIEINNDFSHRIAQDGDLVIKLLDRALGSGAYQDWEPLMRYGIRRITQCHHSEDRKVVVGNGGQTREYPIS